jgi:Holliday junction resolvase RusA-like endonuclease
MEATVSLSLELPYPPSVNTYWRRVGHRVLLSRQGRDFRGRVLALLAPLHLEPLRGALAVEMDAYPPDRRVRDLDNLPKGVLDALAHGGVYADDSQVVRLLLVKMPPVKGGKLMLRVEEVS